MALNSKSHIPGLQATGIPKPHILDECGGWMTFEDPRHAVSTKVAQDVHHPPYENALPTCFQHFTTSTASRLQVNSALARCYPNPYTSICINCSRTPCHAVSLLAFPGRECYGLRKPPAALLGPYLCERAMLVSSLAHAASTKIKQWEHLFGSSGKKLTGICNHLDFSRLASLDLIFKCGFMTLGFLVSVFSHNGGPAFFFLTASAHAI